MGKINDSRQLYEYVDSLTHDSVVRMYRIGFISWGSNYSVSMAVYVAKFHPGI